MQHVVDLMQRIYLGWFVLSAAIVVTSEINPWISFDAIPVFVIALAASVTIHLVIQMCGASAFKTFTFPRLMPFHVIAWIVQMVVMGVICGMFFEAMWTGLLAVSAGFTINLIACILNVHRQELVEISSSNADNITNIKKAS